LLIFSWFDTGFQAEIGSVSHPELESLKRFLSSDALISFPRCGVTSCFQVHQEWNYLRWLPFTEEVSGLDRICQFQYPPVDNFTVDARMDSIEDYGWAAQFAQYTQYNALVQGYSHRMFDWYSAFYIWKTSSPSPTLRGSLYDWYLSTNGGYWGARAGLSEGSPFRLIFNRRDWTLHVVNTSPKGCAGTVIRWTAYSLNGTRVGSDTISLPVLLNGKHVARLEYKLPWIRSEQAFMPELQNILMYRMELFCNDEEDFAIDKARNDYYLTDPYLGSQSQSRYALLGAFRKVVARVRLEVSCNAHVDSMDIECTIVHSQKETVAIMTRFMLMLDPSEPDGSDNRILPSFYSRNYITLLPGESSNVVIKTTYEHKQTWLCLPDGYVGVETSTRGGFFLMVMIDGWNVENRTILIGCTHLLAMT
jgi:mannosylglycoprotein endo-beta-mannosidase